jgi:hypothetical protein
MGASITNNAGTNMLAGAVAAAALTAGVTNAADTNLPSVDRAALQSVHPAASIISTNPVADVKGTFNLNPGPQGGTIGGTIGGAHFKLAPGESTVLYNGSNWVLAAVTPSIQNGHVMAGLSIVGPNLEHDVRMMATASGTKNQNLTFKSAPAADPNVTSYSFAAVPEHNQKIALVTPAGDKLYIPKEGGLDVTLNGTTIHFDHTVQPSHSNGKTQRSVMVNWSVKNGTLQGDHEVMLGGAEGRSLTVFAMPFTVGVKNEPKADAKK